MFTPSKRFKNKKTHSSGTNVSWYHPKLITEGYGDSQTNNGRCRQRILGVHRYNSQGGEIHSYRETFQPRASSLQPTVMNFISLVKVFSKLFCINLHHYLSVVKEAAPYHDINYTFSAIIFSIACLWGIPDELQSNTISELSLISQS